MRNQKLIIDKASLKMGRMLLMICLVSSFFVACRKDDIGPLSQTNALNQFNVNLSASKLILLQGNAGNTAITFNWGTAQNGSSEKTTYTIESAVRGTKFADPIELGSTDQLSVGFTVKEFNQQMRKLLSAGIVGMADFRIKAAKSGSQAAVVYSEPVALEVTTYQPYIEYDNSYVIRIPGNFQDWNLLSAPKVISPDHTGEYEGYLNFTNPYSQFLMVKGTTQWDPKVTYDYIGSNKFGFGGSVFSIFGGAGIYRLKVDINTNTWSYTKINTWGLNGNAVSNDGNAETDMAFDANTLSWSVTTDLNKGDFRFWANKNADINFGHNTSSELGIPNYNGESIHITKTGNYTITLSLKLAGNYAYSVQRNS